MSDDEFVARVMSGCALDSAPKYEPRQHRRLDARAAVIFATAAGFGLLWYELARDRAPDSSVVAARGATDHGITATVQAFVGRSRAGQPARLLDGATLSPGDGIVIRYSNAEPVPVYLMVFAVDGAGAVHWLHPAYLDASSNPKSVELAGNATERVLPEIAEPENPEPGRLRVFALLSRTPYDVQSVEQRLAAGTSEVPLLFPQAEVEEWSFTWRAE
jgi:hypothetical protein